MNRWITRLRRAALLVVTAVLVASTAADAWAADKRLALVVGNARYPTAPLNNPENDAHVVAATLRRLGFEVLEYVNLPVKDFRRILREYSKRVQDTDGTALFFYAGHGVQIEGRNYLLPVDINVRDEFEIKDEAVDIDELFVSRLERARAQVRIIILDACRDNPFGTKSRGLRSIGTGLVEMGARGALIAYSSAPGATAEDGPPGTNSVFTRHMVKEMLVEGLEVEQMFKNVRVKVLRDTNQRQIPWLNSSMIANFSFNPRAGGDAPEGARREDLARLQASLEKRERDQKELEEKVKKLSRELEQAQAQAAASKPTSAAAAQPTAAPSAATPVATAPPAAAPTTTTAPAAPAPAVAKAQQPPQQQPFVLPTAPTGAGPPEPKQTVLSKPAAQPKSTSPAAPAAKTETRLEAKLERKPEPKSAEPKPTPAEVKFAQAPNQAPLAKAPPPGRKSEGTAASERCVALLIRAQLGEQLSPAEMSYLQKECR